jgi:hypothetical protein
MKGGKNKNKEKDAKEVVSSVLWTKGGRFELPFDVIM